MIYTDTPKKYTEKRPPSDPLTRYEDIFRHHLQYLLHRLELKQVQLAREYAAQYHTSLSVALVSHWVNGERRVSPQYYPGLKSLLAGHLKMASFRPEYGLEQETLDWDGLVYTDEQLAREKRRPQPVILGDLPRFQPGVGHFYRKAIRDQIGLRLLQPDPESGIFQPGIVVMTGLPGSGRSEMVLEVLERVAWFFGGGILFADLSHSTSAIWQTWAQGRRGSRAQTLAEIEKRISQHLGRWLLVVENIADGKKLRDLLPDENLWVLATAYGPAVLQPLGWEKYAIPLAPLSEYETMHWLKERLNEQWGKANDKVHARELHRLIEGLPMALAILSALVRSRGWQAVFDAVRDPQRAIAFIRYRSRQETPTSALAKALDLALEILSPQEKEVLRELALYAPGGAIPAKVFHQLVDPQAEVVQDLTEKGLIQRFEDQRLQTTILRVPRLLALHARERLGVQGDRLLAHMANFLAHLGEALAGNLLGAGDVFDRLYMQRKLLTLARNFWRQFGRELSGEATSSPMGRLLLNNCAEAGATLTWLNSGPQAALAWLETLWQMPFMEDRAQNRLVETETWLLWGDLLQELSEFQNHVGDLPTIFRSDSPGLHNRIRAGLAGMLLASEEERSEGVLMLCNRILDLCFFGIRVDPRPLYYVWSTRALRILFDSLWRLGKYSEACLLAGQTLPFFLALSWRRGLEARWWDFKATLAVRGRSVAQEKLENLREHEKRYNEALGLAELAYTPLAEVLATEGSLDQLLIRLGELSAAYKHRALPDMERETRQLAEAFAVGKLDLAGKWSIPSQRLRLWLQTWRELLEELGLEPAEMQNLE